MRRNPKPSEKKRRRDREEKYARPVETQTQHQSGQQKQAPGIDAEVEAGDIDEVRIPVGDLRQQTEEERVPGIIRHGAIRNRHKRAAFADRQNNSGLAGTLCALDPPGDGVPLCVAHTRVALRFLEGVHHLRPADEQDRKGRAKAGE